MTANEKDNLVKAIGPKYAARLKSAEMLAVGWLEVKLPEETEAYRHAMKVAQKIVGEAFSNKVSTPGKTTTEDVVWWMRQRVAEYGLGGWFHPSVDIQRKGGLPPDTPPDKQVIERGDMLHCDFGLVYFSFSTDTQHLAYVLQAGETDAPAGLKAGLKAANRLQDLTMQYAKLGATGNQALAPALLLEAGLGYRVSPGERFRRWVFNHPTPVYLGSVVFFTLIILLGGTSYARNVGATFLQWIGAGILLLIPALTVSVSLVNWMVTLVTRPRVLPKMDFEKGIPVECKTLVVIPSLLSRAANVKSLLEELELHFLRNQDLHLYFALLTDLPDASRQPRLKDDPLVEQADAGIRALNEKSSRGGARRSDLADDGVCSFACRFPRACG